MDAEVIKCRLEKSEKQWKKMKRDNIAKQIKDAKEYKKMFGNWVRKEWTVDEEEIEMWEEAEAKMKAKEEKVLQEIVKGEVEQLTVEEMKNLLKEADEKRIFQEEKENLQTMIDKKEKNCEKKRQRREISAEKYLQMLREPLVEHCEKQKRISI
ncbi:uncharacterized protein MONOS_7681 [Monocercomonoides exilis]|uniref:uncharacterized protein n=1 Tax=Monocercomonoides exilis TaxID=2049356 RepID=UPI00355991EA|nr:hypothetical protein MONOS_7681 [Monocercomonoides exilis]|eukprot:MONOS_7681.1-p1 / transcript=MONOS_7681.1 / gene=MONOS_7681 / organism=Monocercomonoides_exilis_PA203 / gene_product=unspecified product / transcript_product=unspecified product / location=Mono_scaffold00268:74221-74741(-) / protein_length=154 / sequence_SO=supercontig / SO=protein_coding / is_pseudo=false